MKIHLPDSFIATIRSAFKEDGDKFLAVLPDLIDKTSHRWGLTDIQPVPNLSYNFVAFAKQRNATLREAEGLSNNKETLQSLRSFRETYTRDVVLKAGVPNRELTSEIAALKWFNGNGACQLLESDADRGLLLLERLKPGIMLAELEDDGERTRIAADLISCRSEVTSPLPPQLIQLSDWFNGLKNLRPHFDGGTGPFPKRLLEQVESSLPELFADQSVRLLHGDFHHFNILSSERGWLVIDPKGVVGPAGYEIGPFMLNPWKSPLDRINLRVRAERRVSIFAERLGWEREYIIQWSTAHAVLSAWWDIQDGMDGSHALQCAEIFSKMR